MIPEIVDASGRPYTSASASLAPAGTTATGGLQAPPAAGAGDPLAIAALIVSDPSIDVAKVKLFVDMKLELERERRRILYVEAMQAAQSEMTPIVKDAQGEANKYARLETIDRAIRPIYTRHGFSISGGEKDPRKDPHNIRIELRCSHKAGHYEDFALETSVDDEGPKGAKTKTKVQGTGSTVSYVRRYLKILIFDLALIDEDKDGAKGGAMIITSEQVATVRGLITKAETGAAAAVPGSVERKILDLTGSRSVELIHRDRYAEVVGRLEDYIRRKASKAEVSEYLNSREDL